MSWKRKLHTFWSKYWREVVVDCRLMSAVHTTADWHSVNARASAPAACCNVIANNNAACVISHLAAGSTSRGDVTSATPAPWVTRSTCLQGENHATPGWCRSPLKDNAAAVRRRRTAAGGRVCSCDDAFVFPRPTPDTFSASLRYSHILWYDLGSTLS